MAFQSRLRVGWKLRTRSLLLGERTLVMAILNLTPDSFSDGTGRLFSAEEGAERGVGLLDEGADVLDLGAESTRPDALPLTTGEEQARLLPTLGLIRAALPDAVLSVDTFHASTARYAIEAGAEIINDVSGLTWDGAMAGALGSAVPPPGVVLMHTRGKPREWSKLSRIGPGDVLGLVRDGLRERLAVAEGAGIPSANIVLDPGFGFGKIDDENYSLLAGLEGLRELGRPILAGVSRKGFLAKTVAEALGRGRPGVGERLPATLAANTAAILGGAHILRVHDVGPAREAAAVADAVLANLETGS